MKVLVVAHQDDAGPGVFAEVMAARGDEAIEWRPDQGAPPPLFDELAGALVLGGAAHPHEVDRHPWLVGEKEALRGLVGQGLPVMGVCLGAELVAEALGAVAAPLPQGPEIGWVEIERSRAGEGDPVLGALPGSFTAFQWHSYAAQAPEGAMELAPGLGGPNAFRAGEAWGIQFHPEVTAEIVDAWLDDHEADGDAVAAGFDPEPVRERTAAEIGGSERMGAALFGAFLDHAARQAR